MRWRMLVVTSSVERGVGPRAWATTGQHRTSGPSGLRRTRLRRLAGEAATWGEQYRQTANLTFERRSARSELQIRRAPRIYSLLRAPCVAAQKNAQEL